MVIPKVAICPICGKKTYLRIEDGSYLKEYPIRVNCMNCKTLIKGVYIMTSTTKLRGLYLLNADVEECDVDSQSNIIRNADYVADISGELPCQKVKSFDGKIICSSPYLEAVSNSDWNNYRRERLASFTKSMDEWRKQKSVAFQLLDEGSIEYIAIALDNKMGDYKYHCDNYLKSIQCLQEVVLNETKYLYSGNGQDLKNKLLIDELSQIDKLELDNFIEEIGGVSGIIRAYKRAIEVFSRFMSIYANVLPAETYLSLKNPDFKNRGIATCSFSDLKSFYQDAYESLLSLLFIPVALDNIICRGNYHSFHADYGYYLSKLNRYANGLDDFQKYKILDNGNKLKLLNELEPLQSKIDLPANKDLRNGIGHNNVKYDGISQIITAYDLKDPNKVKYKHDLMDVAIDCIGLTKSAVAMSEIILFLLRYELRKENVHSIIHPRYYKNTEMNDKCPCGSGIKYKKCCREDVVQMYRMGKLKD